WTEYTNDLTFTNAQYSYISHDAPFLFGLTCAQAESDFFHAQLQRDKILQQAKRKANKLEENLYFNDPYDNRIIKNELPIIKSGWSGSNKITQALGVKLKELQDDNCETKHQLKNMKNENNESELSNNEYSNSENQTIKKLTLKGRLGSTVFVSTDVFLDLVLNQPCLSCSDIDPKNQKAQIKVDGLQIHTTLTCSLCSSKTEYCNEREEEVRSILALLGVTKQSGDQQYFNKQAEFFQSLYQIADKSVENLLILVCEQLRNNNQDILEVLFDCAWSHVREAMQATSSRANNPEVSTPTDEELIWMYTEGLIYHLQENHNNTDENQCKWLLEFLKKITKLKENQSLITTIRTSYNEAFNRLKLNYVEKKTDYSKSFRARHALSIIHNNEGSVRLQHKIRAAGNLISFSDQDEKNLLNIWKYKN
ncbi:23095_t:CDS:2, partial [Gigaspora rosea]